METENYKKEEDTRERDNKRRPTIYMYRVTQESVPLFHGSVPLP